MLINPLLESTAQKNGERNKFVFYKTEKNVQSQTLKRNFVTQLILASILMAIYLPLNRFLIFSESHIIEAAPALTSEIFCISALLVFLPFLKFKLFTKKIFFRLFIIGSIEFGLMSIFAQLSLKFLEGHVVALLMLTTPIYMFLIEGFSLKKDQYLRFFITFSIVLASIIGWVIYEAFFEYDAQKNLQFRLNFKGVLFTQLSNISFAVGQILLKKFFEKTTELSVICASPVLYLGATIMCMPLALSSIFIPKLTIPPMSCVLSLLVFGIIFFGVAQYLWNVGITKTNIRTVSVLSNIQIPMAVIISGIVFRENVSHKTFALALILMCVMLVLGLSTHKNLIADNV